MGVEVSIQHLSSDHGLLASELSQQGSDVVLLPVYCDEDVGIYRDSSLELVKLLREQGLTVTWAHPSERRRYLAYKANDWWLPALLVAKDVLVAGGTGVLVNVLCARFEKRRSHRPLDVELTVLDPERLEFISWKATGDAQDVLEAVKELRQIGLDGEDSPPRA